MVFSHPNFNYSQIKFKNPSLFFLIKTFKNATIQAMICFRLKRDPEIKNCFEICIFLMYIRLVLPTIWKILSNFNIKKLKPKIIIIIIKPLDSSSLGEDAPVQTCAQNKLFWALKTLMAKERFLIWLLFCFVLYS
jgi:hypothetical protein